MNTNMKAIEQLAIVKRSPFESNDLELCLLYNPKAHIVLVQDGVIAACGQHKWSKALAEKAVFVIDIDLDARGLSPSIGQRISYDDWVELTERAEQIQSW